MPTILCQRGLFLKTLGEIHGRKAVDEAKPGAKRRVFHNSGAAKCRQVPARRVSWGTEGSPRYHGSKPVELHKEWPRVVMRGPLAWRVLARSWGDRAVDRSNNENAEHQHGDPENGACGFPCLRYADEHGHLLLT
ncbi:MAG: hypothetical protein A2122_01630 [Candidatus Liptonbacteria bacterium GWB1_49_6]|uniref:Uncharacterized protein n=1 Tax=Candidatus Liptonbacteria bacterium GWB1_49_6 TaxID=1798644 RepID=A0A1G2C4S1_9BACT|nr:MAG: hypothetical protein A2122_01630 [Candidatus Liptonbacteria bacterium GWB1_49_6]